MACFPATPLEYRQWYPLLRIMAARLAVLMIVMASVVSVVYDGGGSQWPFYLFLGAAFGITILYAFWLRSEKTAGASVPHQFAVDPLIVTGLVYFTGGIDSQLYLLYPLIVLAAGIAVSGRHAMHVTLLSILVYTLLVSLLYSGLLVLPGMESTASYEGTKVFQDLMFRNLMIALVGAATIYFTGRLTSQQEILARVGYITSSILDGVATPLFAVSETGDIISANAAASHLTGLPAGSIAGQPFNSIFEGDSPDLERGTDSETICRVKKQDGTSFPAFCAASKGSFPRDGARAGAVSTDLVDIYLVTLFDLSHDAHPELPDDANRQKRTAATIATEMAHMVRNPLTAIRGAGELLNAAVDHLFTSSRQLSNEDWQTVKTMCNLIFEQSLVLDDKVKMFLEAVKNGSTDVENALDEAAKWSSKVLPEEGEKEADGKDTGS